jgi:hypothetical protein
MCVNYSLHRVCDYVPAIRMRLLFVSPFCFIRRRFKNMGVLYVGLFMSFCCWKGFVELPSRYAWMERFPEPVGQECLSFFLLLVVSDFGWCHKRSRGFLVETAATSALQCVTGKVF